MITADQLLAHGVGDYLLQSHWMAQEKTSHALPAALHAVTYTMPFLLFTQAPLALLVIAGTHFVIDRWRLARYVVWFKNWCFSPMAALNLTRPTSTGYPESAPVWLSTWLLIIADNIIHITINGAALRWLV